MNPNQDGELWLREEFGRVDRVIAQYAGLTAGEPEYVQRHRTTPRNRGYRALAVATAGLAGCFAVLAFAARSAPRHAIGSESVGGNIALPWLVVNDKAFKVTGMGVVTGTHWESSYRADDGSARQFAVRAFMPATFPDESPADQGSFVRELTVRRPDGTVLEGAIRKLPSTDLLFTFEAQTASGVRVEIMSVDLDEAEFITVATSLREVSQSEWLRQASLTTVTTP